MSDVTNFEGNMLIDEGDVDMSDLLCGEYLFLVKDDEGVITRSDKMIFFFPADMEPTKMDLLINKAYMKWLKDGLGVGSGYELVSMMPVEEYFYELNNPTH
jgi:hypothetical protein